MPDREGMYYDNVRRRLNRMKKAERKGNVKNPQLKRNLENSLLNQARKRDGEGAVRELKKEMRHK